MDKRSPLRLIYNLLLIIIIIVSTAATGVISLQGYHAKKLTEMNSDEIIIDQVKQKCLWFDFHEDDIWNITRNPGENNRSFTADISIVQTKELCKKYYRVQILYKLSKGKGYIAGEPEKMPLIKTEWSLQNSKWVASADGTTYTVLFKSDMEAEISIEKMKGTVSDDTVSNENDIVSNDDDSDTVPEINETVESTCETEKTVENTNSDSTDIKYADPVQKVLCELAESDDKESLEGTCHILKDEDISLIITEDTVKLHFKWGDIPLKRK